MLLVRLSILLGYGRAVHNPLDMGQHILSQSSCFPSDTIWSKVFARLGMLDRARARQLLVKSQQLTVQSPRLRGSLRCCHAAAQLQLVSPLPTQNWLRSETLHGETMSTDPIRLERRAAQ